MPLSRLARRTHSKFALARIALACVILFFLGGAAITAQGQDALPDSISEDALDVVEVPTATAQFTTRIENREPVDQISFVKNDVRKIFFFSELRNLAGETVSHQWTYGGRVIAVVAFEVGGPRWRVWSSKEMKPDWTGDWTVEILRSDGEVVAAETFSYTRAEN